MKIRVVLFLIIVFAAGQTFYAQFKKVNIECDLAINETKWKKDSRLTATLTLKNNSDRKAKIYLPPHFILEKTGIDVSRTVLGDSYSSKEKETDHIVTEKTRNGDSYRIRQFFEFSLKAGESKTIEFNLTNFAWNATMSSVLADRSWFKIIPNGDYNLYYWWSYELDHGQDARTISIVSNKIKVELNNEK